MTSAPTSTPAPRRLISLKVSPWSERAKWSLDHHGIAYEVVEHLPVVGERRLRRLVGPNKPQATVPVLIDGDAVMSESWEIASYADSIGKGETLMPKEHEAALRRWAALADETMVSGRQLIIAAMLASPAALDEAGPPFVPPWMRGAFRPIARLATRGLAKKYGMRLDDGEAHLGVMRRTLTELRRVLGSSPFLLGSFSYADIVMGTLLQGISPVDHPSIRLGPATKRVWTQSALATEFPDLLAWRDTLYAKRPRRAGR